jgi:hypothetical protein
MNPYLEGAELWTEVHHRLITALANDIETNLSRDYRVAIEIRVYTLTPEDAVLVGIPDVAVVSQRRSADPTVMASNIAQTVLLPMPEEIRESYLEIRDVRTGAVITVIEILSPTNKRVGKGRTTYESKRNTVLGSATHLVEIDLLRAGDPMAMLGQPSPTDYRILVSRTDDRPKTQLYAFNLQQPIPEFYLPLKPTDSELAIDLQNLLFMIYKQARYDLAIAYLQDPTPALIEADYNWMNALLVAQGWR